MPDSFIVPQDVVDLLGRGDPDDPGLVIATDGACDMIRSFTDQTITAETTTESFDGTGSDVLLLPELPVTQAGTVLVDGDVITDYVLSGNGMLFRGSAVSAWFPSATWPRGRQNVTVTYDHGYATDDIPQALHVIAVAVATRIFVQGPVTAETIGRQIAVTYAGAATDFTVGEQMILTKYRR